MVILNGTNYVSGASQYYDASGELVRNGRVNVYLEDSLQSSFNLDSSGYGTANISAGNTYKFEIYSSENHLVSVLFPVMLGDFGGGGSGSGDVEAEKAARIKADEELQSQIDAKMDKGAIDSELNALRNKDAELQNKINSNQYQTEAAIANETASREAADTQLQSNIDSESARAEAAESALGTRIDGVESDVEAIDTRLTTAESDIGSLQQGLADEIEDRGEADRDLQSQIDAISSKSDVVDVVASYVELLAYDTSELGDNDVIKVLRDETQDDAESYYRWHIVTSTWSLIGTQGPFVTPAEMQTELNGKVDKVTGKGLSTNDYTTAEKNKLAGIASGAEVNVNADWNANSGDAQILNKPSTFPPSSHTHTIANVTGLQGELDEKAEKYSHKYGVGISVQGWYRSFVSSIANVYGNEILFCIDRGYLNARTESYCISVSIGYGGKISFTQINGISHSSETKYITKIRVDYVDSGYLAVDFYTTAVNNNRYFVYGNGVGSFQTPTLVESPTGTTKEFELSANGIKFTSRSIQTNLGSTSASNFDGSANITPGVTGTLPITNGGTGAATAKAAQYNLLKDASELFNDFGDESILACAYATSQESLAIGKIFYKKVKYLWNWIAGKISSVLGLTATNYGGTAAKATADASGNNIASTYAKADGSNASGDWAISATKGKLVTRTNFDELITSGTYEVLLEGNELTNSTNPPTEGTTANTCRGFIEVRNVGGTTNLVLQQATYNVGYIATRRRLDNAWTSWERMTYIPNGSAVGSTTQPVFVDATGQVVPGSGCRTLIIALLTGDRVLTSTELTENSTFLRTDTNERFVFFNRDNMIDGKSYLFYRRGAAARKPYMKFQGSGGTLYWYNTGSSVNTYSLTTSGIEISVDNLSSSQPMLIVRSGNNIYVYGY